MRCAEKPLCFDQRSENGIPVEVAFYKAGNFFAGLAKADTELREDCTELFLGVRTAAGDYQRCKTVNDQPHVTEVTACRFGVHMVNTL